MANLDFFYQNWTPRLLSVLRIVAGLLFIWHGTQKLFGFPPPAQAMAGPMPTIILVAGVLELGGGLLLILGLFTRPVAFILSGLMAVAYFMAHASKGLLPVQNGGELAALYSFVFLFLAVAGGGAWGLDALMGKGRRTYRS